MPYDSADRALSEAHHHPTDELQSLSAGVPVELMSLCYPLAVLNNSLLASGQPGCVGQCLGDKEAVRVAAFAGSLSLGCLAHRYVHRSTAPPRKSRRSASRTITE